MEREFVSARRIRRILVVEDEPLLRREICRALRSSGREIVEAGTLESAREQLPAGFDLVLLDVGLPDGSGVDLAVAASTMAPAPFIVAMSGQATTQEAFGLAQLGVVAFLTKPFSVEQLLAAVERATTPGHHYEAVVRTYVGSRTLREVQEGMRNAMIQQALAVTRGNRAEAAKLLGISRQALQKLEQGKQTKQHAREPAND